jgi:hypothetical protein
MDLRGFVKCLADGHNYANTLLSLRANSGLATHGNSFHAPCVFGQ